MIGDPRLVADALVVAHAAFVAFVVGGGFLAWRWPRVLWVHVPAVAWASIVTLAGVTCPLTPLELAWRKAAGQAGYAGGFVQHYVFGLLYPAGLTRPGQAAIGGALVAITAIAYGGAWLRWRRACGAPTRSSARRGR